jgi:hypothetical protein
VTVNETRRTPQSPVRGLLGEYRRGTIGNDAFRVFNVSANATISDLMISDGSFDQGGGIFDV